MASAGSVTVDFAAETAKFSSELKKVRSELKTLQTSVGSISTQLGKAGNAVKGFVAGFAIVATARAAITAVAAATAESEAAVSGLESALKSAGKSVTSESARFQKFASDMQGVTTFTDEAVIGVQTLLLSFKGLSGDTVLGASKAVLDVSTRLGTDLRSASIAVGKALQDPIKGMTALGRLGVVVSDSQKDFIKTLVNSGQSAKAQAVLIKELEDRFGGAAAAARDNFSGALTGLKNSLGDLLEVKGGLPETTQNLNDLSKVLQDPGVRAGADALFGSLIGGAASAAKFIGEVAAGLAILAGKGGNDIVNLDREISVLEAKRNRILTSAHGDQSLLGPGFRKELDDANHQIDELLRKQRQLLELGEFSGSVRLKPQAVTATRLEERAPQEFDFDRELKNIELRQKIIDNSLQASFATLDDLAAKAKPITEEFNKNLTVFAERELDILVESIDRKIAIEQQYSDVVIEETRRRAAAEAARAQETVKVREDTAFKSIAILGFFVQGQKSANKALELANKAQALRQIAIDSRAAAVSALKIFGPTPLGYAAAAAAIAFGALQAKGILAADTSFNVGGGAPAAGISSGATDRSTSLEQSITAQPQSATTVYINGVVTTEVVDQLVDSLEDRFRRGVIVIKGGTNQANEIRRGN